MTTSNAVVLQRFCNWRSERRTEVAEIVQLVNVLIEHKRFFRATNHHMWLKRPL